MLLDWFGDLNELDSFNPLLSICRIQTGKGEQKQKQNKAISFKHVFLVFRMPFHLMSCSNYS